MDNSQGKAKEIFSNAWKKAADIGKKTAVNAKSFAEQTKKNIHDQQAKKYMAVTADEFKAENFRMPSVIEIKDDSANREFIESADAIGWIEKHKDVPVLHMYSSFVKSCGLTFIPLAQRENVYCLDNFEAGKYINANQIFGKATQEKLAELNNIAYVLGAKSCSIEILEAEGESDSLNSKAGIKGIGNIQGSVKNTSSKKQSGKNISYFEGHDDPQMPRLKWFAHDDNIKGLIDMRCKRAIRSNVLELKGSSSVTMSRSVACAIDDVLGAKGSLSMEKQAVREYSNTLLFEIEF